MERLTVGVCKTFQELVAIMAIRGASYIGEQGRSFGDDWDGNDFSSTQIIAKVEQEPAGCARIRYFSEFVVVERFAVLPKYRKRLFNKTTIALEITKFIVDFCARKGYHKVYDYPMADLHHMWRKVWDRAGVIDPISLNRGITFAEGKTGTLFVGYLPELEQRLDISRNPDFLVEPEGEWTAY